VNFALRQHATVQKYGAAAMRKPVDKSRVGAYAKNAVYNFVNVVRKKLQNPTTNNKRHTSTLLVKKLHRFIFAITMSNQAVLVHGQVTIIFVLSGGLSVCLFVCMCRVFLSRL